LVNTKKSIHILVGARPNFIKVTRFKELGAEMGFDVVIIHSGQHYDEKMSHVFFDQFELRPDYFLNLEKSSRDRQIPEIIAGLEKLYSKIEQPQLLIVPGDVNSTLAGAMAANKLGIALAHLESGLRSFQNDMPEEHNRVKTDQLSDYCFVTEDSGMENLKKENISARSFFVGNTMIDTLVHFSEKIDDCDILEKLNVHPQDYFLVTFHRPENVDSQEKLKTLIDILKQLSERRKVVFPIHPRTAKNLKKLELWQEVERISNLIIVEPMGYFEFQKLIAESKAVFTDSGGIQEETTFRLVPCVTLRKSTERPITTDIGTNSLIYLSVSEVEEQIECIEGGQYKKGKIPKFWDGKSTERILSILRDEL